MKKLLTLLAFLSATTAFSQTAGFVFFSENGERFTVILNGLRKNDAPETNVKVSGLIAAPYMVRIIFADTALGIIEDKVYAMDNKERTYAVRARKISSSEKGLKKVGVNLGRQLEGGDKKEAAAKKEEIENTDSKYVLKLISEVATGNKNSTGGSTGSGTSTSGNSVSGQAVQQQSTVKTGVNQTTSTTSTTISSSAGSTNNENANISLNVNIEGAAVGTTTTTTTTQTSNSQASAYPDPSSPNRCSYPMNDGSFEAAKKSIEEKSFEESQLTMAKQVVGNNCMSSNQVKQLMMVFSFEESRLELAKYAYEHTFDKQNYYKVNDAFTFESSIDELNKFIESKR